MAETRVRPEAPARGRRSEGGEGIPEGKADAKLWREEAGGQGCPAGLEGRKDPDGTGPGTPVEVGGFTL